ncbi:MAG: hypothetical protein ABIL09_07555 [Gemmatimonadota bacterium]
MCSRVLLLALAVLLTGPGAGPAAPGGSAASRAALEALRDDLAQGGTSRSHDLVAALAARLGLPAGQLRAGLGGQLQRFEAALDSAGPDREVLEGLGEPELTAGQTRRYLRELAAAGRALLDPEASYVVEARLRWAARRARVPAAKAGPVLDRLLAQGLGTDAAADTGAGEGLVVSGWTSQYDLAVEPLYLFLDTQDAAAVREAVRDVQRFVVPPVVRLLARSPRVRFAVRDRDLTALVDPTYQLHIEVQALRFAGTNTDLRPCLEATLSLTPFGQERPAWSAPLDWCTEVHGSAAVHRLDPFFEEVAARIAAMVDEALAPGP